VFDDRSQVALDRVDIGRVLVAVAAVVVVGAPGGEHARGELEAALAEGLLLGEACAVATEVALQV
jgi:hypothetical protein